MSGLEVIGAAASIIQIADAGLKLYNYIDSVASANKRLARVNKNLETTCNVVKEIGEVFQRKETASLISKRAVKTAHDAAEECQVVFGELRDAVEKSKKNKFVFPLREGKLEVLSVQLEKLKSTIMLLMTLLLHARELRDETSGKEREQILELIRARDEATVRYEEIKRAHDLLVANLWYEETKRAHDLLVANLPAGGGHTAPGFNSFSVAPTGLDIPGTRSPGDEAGNSAPHGKIRNDISTKTLDETIRKVFDLLESLKAMQEVVDDTSAFSKAKANARMVYRNVRTPLDDLLLNGEYTPAEPTLSAEGHPDADLVTKTFSSVAQSKEKAKIRKAREQKERSERLKEKAGSSEGNRDDRDFEERMERQRLKFERDREAKRMEEEMRGRLPKFEFQDNQHEAVLDLSGAKNLENTRYSRGNTPDVTKERQRLEGETRALVEQLRRIEIHLDGILQKKRLASINAPARTTPEVYTKISSSYLDIRTLQRFELPFETDQTNPPYYIIRQEMDKEETDALFEHTRILRRLEESETAVAPQLRPASDLRVETRGQRSEYAFVGKRRPVIEEDDDDDDDDDEDEEEKQDEIDELLREWTTLEPWKRVIKYKNEERERAQIRERVYFRDGGTPPRRLQQTFR